VNSRRKRLEREIERDARMATSGYVHEVMNLTLGRLQYVSLANQCPDPVALFDQVDEITRKFRNFHRRLNDGRINRRGERDRHALPSAEVPAAVQPFAYHGAYLGAFSSVEDFAHACLDPSRPDQWAAYVDLTQAGIDLHLSGRYWTVDADGVTYAFTVDGSGPGRPSGGLTEREPDAPERAEPPRGPEQPTAEGAAAAAVAAAGAAAAALAASMPTLSLAHRDALPGGGSRFREQPPLPRYEPERARVALAGAGCDERTIATLMAWYVAGYATPGAHVWYFLRRGGLPGRLLGRADLDALARDWCGMAMLAWASDADGGVQVFAFGDPLASDR